MERTRKQGTGSEKRQRKALHAVRLTPAERDELSRRASEAGMSVGAYVRRQAIGTEGPRSFRSRPLPEERALRDMIGQLGYIGNNLNQLTRAVNMGDLEEPRELARTMSMCFDLMDDARKLLNAPS